MREFPKVTSMLCPFCGRRLWWLSHSTVARVNCGGCRVMWDMGEPVTMWTMGNQDNDVVDWTMVPQGSLLVVGS